MKPIVLISGGSRGDVQPFLLLGKALQDAGSRVLLALPPSYAAEAEASGLNFRPLRADFDALLAGQSGQNLKNSGRNPFAVVREGRRMMQDIGRLLVEDVDELVPEAGAVIGHIGLSACTQAITTLGDVPLIHVTFQPFMPTRDFPHPLLPVRQSLGGLYNRLTGHLVRRVTWSAFGGETRRLLKSRPNGQAFTWQDFAARLDTTLILNAFSASVIPFPTDWKSNNAITGFWLPPADTTWQPPRELITFLNAGAAPIFIGFGSVSDTTSVQMLLEAVQLSGERAVLVGFNMPDSHLPATVLAMPSIPYAWLFHHVKAVIHHGGAGTTAQALYAGLPMLAVPQLLDQFFWAEWLYHRGAALKPVPQKQLTAVQLAADIARLAADHELRTKAALTGAALRKENGLENAVRLIQQRPGIQPA